MTIAPPQLEQRVVLDGVSWELYEQMLAEVGDGHVRLTYDEGRLEIMSPSGQHELIKTVLGRLIEAYGDAADIAVQGFGSTTFRRKDLQKGLEPDECYYVQHFDAVLGKEELDLTVDPAPDLAIEVDISPAEVAREPIYAAFQVAEVWRYGAGGLTPLRRTAEGRYAVSDRSLVFPLLPIEVVNRLVRIGLSAGQPAAVRALREWMRSGTPPPQE